MHVSHAVRRLLFVAAPLLVLAWCWHNRTSVAAPYISNTSAVAQVSFTFDDGLSSALTKAAPILAKYNFRGTDYVITDCVASSGTCAANPSADYMTWPQIKTLQQQYGWEIGSHTVTHPMLDQMSVEKQDYELSISKKVLADHGFTATSLASPYGDYGTETLALSAKYYTSHRGFWDIGYNRWPYNDYLLAVQQIQSNVSVNIAKTLIDHAIQNKQWLIFVFHDIKDHPSQNPDDFEYATNNLDQIAHYAKQRGVRVNTITQSLPTSDENLLTNSSFNDVLHGGWTTDTPDHVHQDCSDNGSYPDAHCSVMLTSGRSSTHLFSPKISVKSNTTYLIKSFLKVATLNSGEVGYYIDEYDTAGRWISGQWKAAERSKFVENINFAYKPTSAKVQKARIQLFLTPNTNIQAYVDNFQWFPISQD